jgi:hypothetical protein
VQADCSSQGVAGKILKAHLVALHLSHDFLGKVLGSFFDTLANL